MTREEALQIIYDHCQHCDETETAFEILKENKGEWIPVTERLPEESGEYLISIKDRSYAEISWFYPNDKKWSYRNADIVAWAYIPEPYKKGE